VLQTARITGPLPLLDVVSCALLPEDLESIRYSSHLLLPATLPSVIVNDATYAQWCYMGFDSCSDGDYDTSSLPLLKAFIVNEVVCYPSDPLVQHVGFLHGWLSALAFTDRTLALAGLSLLARLADHLVFLSSGVCL
jgi:hypothetical protein